MSKKLFLAVLMMMSLPFCSLQVSAAPAPVGLEVGFDDPEHNGGNPQRGPVMVPEVGIEDYTLTFSTPCYGFTLELLDEDGDVFTPPLLHLQLSTCPQHSAASTSSDSTQQAAPSISTATSCSKLSPRPWRRVGARVEGDLQSPVPARYCRHGQFSRR